MLAERPLPMLALLSFGLAYLIGRLASIDSARAAKSLLALGATVFALGTTRGMICGDRSDDRWFVLFQRGVSPLEHYSRILLATLVTIALLLLGPSLSLLAGGSSSAAFGSFAAALIWALLVAVTAAGVSSVVTKHDLEVTLLFLLISVAQRYLFTILGIGSSGIEILRRLMIPVDGAFQTWNWAVGEGVPPATGDQVHLLFYPVVWLGIIAIRLRNQ